MTSTMPTEQAPGFLRRRVGDMVVTAVNDGMAVSNFDSVRGIEAADAETVLRAAFRGAAPTFTFNTYLVQDGTRTVLIDTGGGGLMGPVAGRLLGNLAAAGVAPGDINAILLTHLHVDHVGGLADASGAAVGGRVTRFTGGEPVPGIAAESLPGHTPGHTGYRIAGDEGGLLIWGDIVHRPDVQSRFPGVTMAFDVDPAQAEATRRLVLARAARERLLVAGMHMHFPGFAHVEVVGEGYRLAPAQWTPGL